MKINIFGSTGEIGTKSLYIINKYFPKIKINLLLANKNYIKLIQQAKYFEPKYILLNDYSKINYLKKELINYKTKIIHPNEINDFLLETKSDLSLLSISGYNSLYYLTSIFKNTKNIGLVNKESIVSAGHLFKKLKKKHNVNIYPLDSEHFSLNYYFNNTNNHKYIHTKISKIYLTATGGPFFHTKLNNFSKILYKSAITHPKWKMGYKNSIDSATLANKCLELIEAHYLFEIPYNLLDIFIHPQALIHSVLEFNNYTSTLNYFFPDMLIPIYNFFQNVYNEKIILNEKNNLKFEKISTLDFFEVNLKRYPIYKIFNELNKESPSEIIKFNIANQIAVDQFKLGKIKFNEIHEYVDFALSLDFTHNINSINNILYFQNYFKKMIHNEKF